MMNTVPAAAPRRRTPTWLWVLLTLTALSVLIVTSVIGWVAEFGDTPVHLVIDGTDHGFFDPSTFGVGQKLALGVGAVLLLLLALILVPVALLIGLVGLVVGVGVPLLLVALALALACSPLLLLVVFVGWLWRKCSARPLPRTANIAG